MADKNFRLHTITQTSKAVEHGNDERDISDPLAMLLILEFFCRVCGKNTIQEIIFPCFGASKTAYIRYGFISHLIL